MNHAHAYRESSYIDVVSGAAPPARQRFPLSCQAALSALHTWLARRRQREDLLELDIRLLRDIGVSPEEAQREARKPFWRE